MSMQDENFTYDEDIEFFCDSKKVFVFPHNKAQRSNDLSKEKTHEKPAISENVETSSSALLQQEDDSMQSSSETSGKTNVSESIDLQAYENKKPKLIRHNQNKSISYQDIHSEYIKRRYRHVESKVGQYIANIRAQDAKRRSAANFQRHSSLPETLHGGVAPIPELEAESQSTLSLRHCANLENCRNHSLSNQDTIAFDNFTEAKKSSPSANHIVVDKQSYEELLTVKERNDYLQSKLEEKNAENWRLKHNLDTIRIEYTLCKDKLKQQNLAQRFTGSIASPFGNTTLHNVLYSQAYREKSTQTDKRLTTSTIRYENNTDNELFAPLLTTHSNNTNFDHAAVGIFAPIDQKLSKSVATIEPLSLNFSNLVEQDLNCSNANTTMSFLRHRSNALDARKKSTPLTGNTSKSSLAASSLRCSSDSAFHIELSDSSRTQQQFRCGSINCHEQHTQSCVVVESENDVEIDMDTQNSADNNTTNCEMSSSSSRRNRRKRHKLRSRVMDFFGVCIKCNDPKKIAESTSQFSQTPLFAKSSSGMLP